MRREIGVSLVCSKIGKGRLGMKYSYVTLVGTPTYISTGNFLLGLKTELGCTLVELLRILHVFVSKLREPEVCAFQPLGFIEETCSDTSSIRLWNDFLQPTIDGPIGVITGK